MTTTTMNIRVPKTLKKSFEKAVQTDGLDSSTAIRVMMLEYTKGNLEIGVKSIFDEEIEQGKRDFENGNFVTANTNAEIDAILDEQI